MRTTTKPRCALTRDGAHGRRRRRSCDVSSCACWRSSVTRCALTHEADTGAPVDPGERYHYAFDRGPQRRVAEPGAGPSGRWPVVRGATLIALATRRYPDAEIAAEAKRLMRSVLDHYLEERRIFSRRIVQDLQPWTTTRTGRDERKESAVIELGVNIDHVATLRQARRTYEPDPVWAAVEAHLGGADGITVHLREDRRHIQDEDVRRLRDLVHIKLNLEMAATAEMIEIACQLQPRDGDAGARGPARDDDRRRPRRRRARRRSSRMPSPGSPTPAS